MFTIDYDFPFFTIVLHKDGKEVRGSTGVYDGISVLKHEGKTYIACSALGTLPKPMVVCELVPQETRP
jgi:hypothetical protein